MTDLWTEASYDYDTEARMSREAHAAALMADVFPFLASACSDDEYAQRLGLAESRLRSVAAEAGLPEEDITALAARHWELMKEALEEGQDPLAEVMQAEHSYGSGPEKPDEHDESADFSHSYGEVPLGQLPGGPPDMVTQPAYPRPAPVSEATGSVRRCACGHGLFPNGRCTGCACKPGRCECGYSYRTAAADYMAETPPDTNTGEGSVDTGVAPEDPSLPVRQGSRRTAQGTGPVTDAGPESGVGDAMPAGVSQGTSSPDGMGPGGTMPASPGTPVMPQGLQQGMMPATGSRRDPVALQVTAVAASVQASNPHLPEAECRRVARKAVARYLTPRQADLTSSVTSDDYGSGGGGDGQGGGHGGGTGMIGHALEWQGVKSLLPEAAEAAAL
jgi:hypothetical protein